MKKLNLIGKRFGDLTVLEECNERDKHGKIVYKCLCNCGNVTYVKGNNLRRGNTNSCGCLKHKPNKHNFKHGKTPTRLYRILKGMKDRCYNNKLMYYKNYGARGIKICDEWLNDFMAFYDWAMSNGYNDNLTIDRIDVNGNYEPNNCRWVDLKTQQNNLRNNILLTYNNKTQTISQWADELGLNKYNLYYRFHRGWNIEDILFGRNK